MYVCFNICFNADMYVHKLVYTVGCRWKERPPDFHVRHNHNFLCKSRNPLLSKLDIPPLASSFEELWAWLMSAEILVMAWANLPANPEGIR